MSNEAAARPGAGRLDRRLAEGRLGPDQIEQLARALHRLHASAPRAEVDATQASPAAVARRALAATEALAAVASEIGLGESEIEELRRRQDETLREGVESLIDRYSAGRVRVIHGDLRCETVALLDGGALRLERAPQAHNASEDSVRDVAQDIARLCVDLSVRGAGDAAERLLAVYALESDDYAMFRVIDFYERHQACRLSVAAVLAQSALARPYALWAIAAGRPPLLPAAVIATTGPVASGKSTVAHGLARLLAAPRVVADRVRDRLLEAPAGSEREVHEALWLHSFSPGFEKRGYEAVFLRAGEVLASGRPVVLDACMPTRERRAEAAALAAAHGVPFWLVECRPSDEVLAQRLRARNERDGCGDEAWQEIASRLGERYEAPTAEEVEKLGHWVRLDTGRSIDECLADARALLPAWPEEFPR